MQSKALLKSVSSAVHDPPLSIFFLYFSIIFINEYCVWKPFLTHIEPWIVYYLYTHKFDRADNVQKLLSMILVTY